MWAGGGEATDEIQVVRAEEPDSTYCGCCEKIASDVILDVNRHSMVVAQIYILRSLTGIAGGDALCQEEGPGSARAVSYVDVNINCIMLRYPLC